MEEIANVKPFNKRAFVTLCMVLSVLIMPISGFMNHELQFEPLTQARHFWMSLHNISAILFVIFVVIHIYLNRRALKNYIARKESYLISKESLAAMLIIAGIIFLFASHAFRVG
jgi:hypothetical protein